MLLVLFAFVAAFAVAFLVIVLVVLWMLLVLLCNPQVFCIARACSLDLRNYFMLGNALRPTRKGIAISQQELAALAEAAPDFRKQLLRKET